MTARTIASAGSRAVLDLYERYAPQLKADAHRDRFMLELAVLRDAICEDCLVHVETEVEKRWTARLAERARGGA